MDKSKWCLALREGGVPASQWASPRFVMVSVQATTGWTLGPKEGTDDRLGILLQTLGGPSHNTRFTGRT
jgi:hypothetical protein